jgi:hypothetical protein
MTRIKSSDNVQRQVQFQRIVNKWCVYVGPTWVPKIRFLYCLLESLFVFKFKFNLPTIKKCHTINESYIDKLTSSILRFIFQLT